MSDFFPLSIEADRVRPITPEYGLGLPKVLPFLPVQCSELRRHAKMFQSI